MEGQNRKFNSSNGDAGRIWKTNWIACILGNLRNGAREQEDLVSTNGDAECTGTTNRIVRIVGDLLEGGRGQEDFVFTNGGA